MTSLWLVAAITLVTLAAAYLVVWAVRRRRGAPLDTAPTLAFIGGAVGLLLSLLLFFAVGHYSEAKATAQEEAGVNLALFSAATGLPDGTIARVQHDSLCVMRSTIADEWPAMESGDLDGSPRTQAYVSSLYDAITSIPLSHARAAAQYGQLDALLVQRGQIRAKRLYEGQPQIPVAMWVVMWALIFIVVVLTGLQEKLSSRGAWLGVSAALVVTVLVSLLAIVALDNPYGPGTAVGPDSMQQAVAVLDTTQHDAGVNDPCVLPRTSPAG